MMMKLPLSVILSLFFAVIAVSEISAQSHDHPHHIPAAYEKIERHYMEGKIDYPEALKQKLAYVFDPTLLRSEFKVEEMQPLKCAFPLMQELESAKKSGDISAQTYNQLKSMLPETPETAATYTSPSGKFRIEYLTSGEDAVPAADSDNDGVPDYVEWTASAADSTWRHYVNTLGYPDWTERATTRINFEDFGYYGLCTGYDIKVHSNFQGFPPNTHPNGDVYGALIVTIGHELKHVVQYDLTRWQGESSSWLEMDATLYEDVSFDNVNDYYNYNDASTPNDGANSSIFYGNGLSFFPGTYYHATWALYFKEIYGDTFWRQVWQDISTNTSTTFLRGVENTVIDLGGEMEIDMTRNMLWHISGGAGLGGRSIDGYGFEEAAFYPISNSRPLNGVQSNFTLTASLPGIGAQFYILTPAASDTGQIIVEFDYNRSEAGIGLTAVRKDGTVSEVVRAAEAGLDTEIAFAMPDRFEDVRALYIAIANTDVGTTNQGKETTNSITYRFRVSNDLTVGVANEEIVVTPSENALLGNYPNPFNPSTQIAFRLDSRQQVQLFVSDMSGRRIKTLASQVFPEGEHFLNFDASDLPSGTYLYTLSTQKGLFSKSMTLIK